MTTNWFTRKLYPAAVRSIFIPIKCTADSAVADRPPRMSELQHHHHHSPPLCHFTSHFECVWPANRQFHVQSSLRGTERTSAAFHGPSCVSPDARLAQVRKFQSPPENYARSWASPPPSALGFRWPVGRQAEIRVQEGGRKRGLNAIMTVAQTNINSTLRIFCPFFLTTRSGARGEWKSGVFTWIYCKSDGDSGGPRDGIRLEWN